jgi:hypothetical protein
MSAQATPKLAANANANAVQVVTRIVDVPVAGRPLL